LIKHIIKSQQFTRELLEKELFPLAREMEIVVEFGGSKLLEGKRMITFFYEPSTRTRASFEIAMDMLGGRVVFSTENATQFSSVVKGETLQDTIRVLNRYRPDVIILRHYEEGSAKKAAEASSIPIINAGDGPGQHPTQSLLDLYTIKKRLSRIDGISVAMVGDLKNGRTVRSLSYLLGKFDNINIFFVAPETATMKKDIKIYLKKHRVKFLETDKLIDVAPKADVIYQTRTQKERGTVMDRSNFIIDKKILGLMKKEAIIMHPLPRNEEIALEVDGDERSVYLTEQIDNGLYIRMALLKMILEP
jgi:aspartate carbamoyltransferase catalytic subunit